MALRQKYFCIVGPAKSGTTTLFNYIVNNTDAAYYSWKETNFLIEPERFQNSFASLKKTLTNYRDSGDIIDASPEYYGMPTKVERNIGLIPRDKYELVAIVGRRDPAERLVSHIEHNISHGVERRSLRQVLEDFLDDKLDDTAYYLVRHIRQEKTELIFSRVFDKVYFFDVSAEGIDACDFLRGQDIPVPRSGFITEKLNPKFSSKYKFLQRLDINPPRILRVLGSLFPIRIKQAIRNQMRKANKIVYQQSGSGQQYNLELAGRVVAKKFKNRDV